jgi:hypothetical protein
VDFSEMVLEILELSSTSSSTKIGQSTRNGNASASLGRESLTFESYTAGARGGRFHLSGQRLISAYTATALISAR